MHTNICENCGKPYSVQFLSRAKKRRFCGLSCKSTATLKRHGMTKTSTYSAWATMRTRCLNPKRAKWYRYGGRGIKICKRWERFENFLSDMGERPNGKTLDRIDNDGDYKPSNCKWSTPKEQSSNTKRNRFVTHNGKTQHISDWAREIGLKQSTLARRISSGWSIELALSTSLFQGKKDKPVRCK